MTGATSRNFSTPDEVRTPPKTRVEMLDFGSAKVASIAFEPGWKWSECIKPVVGTDSCQVRHVGLFISGALHVEHADGSAIDLEPGSAYVIEPGHDAWVTSHDKAVMYEFESVAAETYAKAPA
jgi:hypothetical protein